MCRTVLTISLFALLGLLAGVWSAGPPVPRVSPVPDAAAKAGPTAAVRARAAALPEKLNRVVKFTGFDDPKTTLLEALDKLAKVHDLAFVINERAFKYEMLNEPARVPVAETPLPPLTAPLRQVLQKVLDRVPVPSGATYLVRRQVIEITTGQFADWEVKANRPFPRSVEDVPELEEEVSFPWPRVQLTFDQCPLDRALDALAEQGSANIVLDPRLGEKARAPITCALRNTPLDTALFLLAAMADLDFIRVDNVFYVTTPARVEALARRWKKHRPRAIDAWGWGEEKDERPSRPKP
jgi:hypothetical protein